MTIAEYLESINKYYKLGTATEHTFRGDLAQLVESLVPDVIATNEPKRMECGAPDYILTRNDIPVGFIEAKDIGDKDLDGKDKTRHKEQFDRYKASLGNLIFTDYLNFHFYRNGELVTKIAIGKVSANKIIPIPENFTAFANLLKNFVAHIAQTIQNPKDLAQMMAGKARLLSDIIEKALNSDEQNYADSTLKEQLVAFRNILIHDITPKEFADVYAQTIAYGMFAARTHDPRLNTFSRQEAAELIPKSNPFLRKLFGHIAGPDIDDRIKWVVDSLAEVFLACNVKEILKEHGKATKTEDPIIHFYETFLSEYDPKLRKSRGVWYTPAPVVSFIVRAVDDILKTEFTLPQGLADTRKTIINVQTQTLDTKKQKYTTIEEEVHKVQILDPATGTGTFLAEVIKHIHQKFVGQEGIWSDYVESHLLPRLNGFELLMASYAMAHLQIDLLLNDTGYHSSATDATSRLRVFLTNSLEESHPDTGTLFASWLSDEANEANRVKRDTPVMVVLGNPPYSGISANDGKWISDLIEDYKYVDGEHFGERKHWLNDDYVKFIRYGQHYIEKNNSGVLAFINPHGFLDNPTFRGMRWNLLRTFDKIYTIDLHGNSNKKESAPDGSVDQNVFDIQQGVSITFFIKTGEKKPDELGKVLHYDVYGKREQKYFFLEQSSLRKIEFEEVQYSQPYYFFVPRDESAREKYEEGFSVQKLFPVDVTGIVTARDSVVIDIDRNMLLQRMQKFTDAKFSDSEIRGWLFPNRKSGKYSLGDSRGWKLDLARQKIAKNNHEEFIKKISYRPFDTREIYYSPDMVDWGRESVMKHLVNKDNVSLVTARQSTGKQWNMLQISRNMVDNRFHFSNKGTVSQFPIYLYPDKNNSSSLNKEAASFNHLFSADEDELPSRVPNLNTDIIKKMELGLGLSFVPEKDDARKSTFAPIDVLDYIYAVLHSPTYRDTYKEFLKIDFPRVPYPTDKSTFWQLVDLGGRLRQIHLLESPVVDQPITQYPQSGDNVVTTPHFVKPTSAQQSGEGVGNVYINQTQYFAGVPEVAWNFYIGGYQPAQKWLKDRKGRTLNFEDISHYQKIIVALFETHKLMREIDEVDVH